MHSKILQKKKNRKDNEISQFCLHRRCSCCTITLHIYGGTVSEKKKEQIVNEVILCKRSTELVEFRSQVLFRLNDFPFQNWPIFVSHFQQIPFDSQFYQFRCVLAIFHTKIMIVLYVGLFFISTVCGVTFDSRD